MKVRILALRKRFIKPVNPKLALVTAGSRVLKVGIKHIAPQRWYEWFPQFNLSGATHL